VQEVAEPPAPESPPLLKRRSYPLLATFGLIIVGMSSTLWWGPRLAGLTAWALPHDLWGTMIAANRLLHGHLGDLYTRPTGLITLPGGALILVPIVALTDFIGLPMHIPGHNADPASWLYAGPYETAISAVALFAADAIAEHLGLSRRRRLVLAAAGAMLLWNVTIRWGHPEDAVAVGLLLYAVLELAKASKPSRSAWLFGLAVAVQPLVLLSLPVVLAVMRPSRIAGYLTRAGIPGAALLGAAALANWHATYVAVTSQPNWPKVNHPTPWLALATPLRGGAVAAGPSRIVAIVVACACAVLVWRQCRAARETRAPQPWDSQTLLQVLWWVAVALAVRSAFEPVMVAYYVWPSLAIALVTSAATWPFLLMTSAVAGTITFASQSSSHSPWIWWAPLFTGLCLTLYLARVRRRAEPQPVLVTAPG